MNREHIFVTVKYEGMWFYLLRKIRRELNFGEKFEHSFKRQYTEVSVSELFEVT